MYKKRNANDADMAFKHVSSDRLHSLFLLVDAAAISSGPRPPNQQPRMAGSPNTSWPAGVSTPPYFSPGQPPIVLNPSGASSTDTPLTES